MPAEMKQVSSSHVNSVGYADGNLYVQWKNGRQSVYSDVPADLAEQVMNAGSVGTALNTLVKDVYEHSYA